MYDGSTIQGKFCQAIAFAEGCLLRNGAYNTHTIPYKLNNPGDLKATASAYTHHMTSTGKLQFSDIGTGWNALAHQVDLMFTNKSFVYRSSMSIQDVANHYAKEHDTPAEQTNANNWAKNVAAYLGVETTTTLEQLQEVSTSESHQSISNTTASIDSTVVPTEAVKSTTKWPGKK